MSWEKFWVVVVTVAAIALAVAVGSGCKKKEEVVRAERRAAARDGGLIFLERDGLCFAAFVADTGAAMVQIPCAVDRAAGAGAIVAPGARAYGADVSDADRDRAIQTEHAP